MMYRRMQESDIEKVIPFYIEYYNARGDEWTEESVRHRIWQVLGSPDSYCLMAEDGENVIGFAMGRFERFYDLTAYNLVEIIIGEPFQNRGLGTALMQELERQVKEEGAALVQLMAVNDDAHNRFYGRLNYQDTTNLVLKGKFL
ncbi:MAG: GNAT family N-acetyltransferase [Oscillospiraceae bacterium]|nr:GNAT family N-acetyltransferase [Oscillospiraceae bacterium]